MLTLDNNAKTEPVPETATSVARRWETILFFTLLAAVFGPVYSFWISLLFLFVSLLSAPKDTGVGHILGVVLDFLAPCWVHWYWGIEWLWIYTIGQMVTVLIWRTSGSKTAIKSEQRRVFSTAGEN